MSYVGRWQPLDHPWRPKRQVTKQTTQSPVDLHTVAVDVLSEFLGNKGTELRMTNVGAVVGNELAMISARMLNRAFQGFVFNPREFVGIDQDNRCFVVRVPFRGQTTTSIHEIVEKRKYTWVSLPSTTISEDGLTQSTKRVTCRVYAVADLQHLGSTSYRAAEMTALTTSGYV